MDQALRLSSLMQVRGVLCAIIGEAIFANARPHFWPGAADDDDAGAARSTVPFTELAVNVVGGLSDVFSCDIFFLLIFYTFCLSLIIECKLVVDYVMGR